MDPASCKTDTAAAAASSMVFFAAVVDGAKGEEVRAKAIGASDVARWWMGSRRRRERGALTVEATMAPPLDMAAAGCGSDEARGPVAGGNEREACREMGQLG